MNISVKTPYTLTTLALLVSCSFASHVNAQSSDDAKASLLVASENRNLELQGANNLLNYPYVATPDTKWSDAKLLDAALPREYRLELGERGAVASTSLEREHSTTLEDQSIASLTEKDWWGAMAEITVVLALGELLYKVGEDSMEDDFDYEIEGNAAEFFADRLFTSDSWKFDDNPIGMNWGHAYAGALYYQAFRNYNFNYYESTLAAFISSSVWEVFAEYKEVVSINDQIVTTWGGAVLGESFFQLAEMMDSKEGWVPATFAAVFNPSQTVRGWFDIQSPNRFNRKYAKDQLSFYTGALYKTRDLDEDSTPMLILGMDASVDSMAGQYDALFGTPSLVNMNMELGVSERGVEDWQLATDLFLGGYVNEVKSTSAARDSWSKRYFFGPSTGAEYVSMGQDADEDFYAVMNLLGLSAGGQWVSQDISVDLRGDIYGDFAMVKPFASRDYLRQYGTYWGSKSVLWEDGYGYAMGHTIKLAMEARYLDLLFGFSIKSHRWNSIDDKELERTGSWNPNYNDLDFKEQRDRYKVYFSYLFSDELAMSLNYEQIEREGTIKGIDRPDIINQLDETEQRVGLQLEYSY